MSNPKCLALNIEPVAKKLEFLKKRMFFFESELLRCLEFNTSRVLAVDLLNYFAEDAGFDCPLSILRLLGKASQGERYRSDGITNEHYLCMQNLRENPLKYTTKSIIDWFKKFINDLLHVYRFSQLSSESVAYQPSSLNRIKFNMEYQRNMVQKIEDMRKQTNDPTLYDSEMTQIKQIGRASCRERV